MCVSWNGPDSQYKDLNCNMHCSTSGKRTDKGEVAAVIRPHMTPCKGPPPPPPPAPAVPIPVAWTEREQGANMYIAENEPMVLGNGYVAAMTHTGIMNAVSALHRHTPRGVDTAHRTRHGNTTHGVCTGIHHTVSTRHTAHRTLHTAHHTPHTAHGTPHTAARMSLDLKKEKITFTNAKSKPKVSRDFQKIHCTTGLGHRSRSLAFVDSTAPQVSVTSFCG